MPIPVTIPQATISMEEGNIVRWFKSDGDAVAEGDLLFEIETDKAVVEVPAPAQGMLLRRLILEGPVKVNDIVAWIGDPGEHSDVPPSVAPKESVSPSATSRQSFSETVVPLQRVAASPAARRRANELGVDLASVTGTGQGGRITEEDVERSVQAGATLGSRKALARQVSIAWREAPHIHIGRELDATGLAALRSKYTDISLTDLFLYALAKALPAFPQLTQVWKDEKLQQCGTDVCLAVETPRGVVTPVLRAIDKLALYQLRQRQKQITEAARAGRVKLDELQGGFTLTNLGMYGADFFTPILNHPQTAILAVGRVKQQPIIASESIGVGWRVWVNLAVDHRVTDGAYAARFLEKFQQILTQLPNDVEVTINREN